MNEKSGSFSGLDKFFFVLTTSGFFFGTTFTCLLYFFPFPILPSIFFGSALSSLVYRFMGGIKPEDSIEIGTVKLSGTLGSLIASIFVLNFMFEQQIPPWSVLINPNSSNIIVVNNDAKPVQLDVQAKGIKTIQTYTLNSANSDLINTFQEACWRGDGICKGEPRRATLIANDSIQQGKARLCMDNANLLGLPLIVTHNNLVTNNFNAIRVEVSDLGDCKDKSKQLLTVELSSEDVVDILEGKITGTGEVSIAPLLDLDLVKPSKNRPSTIANKD